MTTLQRFITVLILAAATWITRFLPFVLFPEGKQAPKVITYLGTTLPYAAIGLLVVYCLKDLSFTIAPFGLPELIAVAVVVVLHIWRRNSLLSIGLGTAAYMILLQFVF